VGRREVCSQPNSGRGGKLATVEKSCARPYRSRERCRDTTFRDRLHEKGSMEGVIGHAIIIALETPNGAIKPRGHISKEVRKSR
jgi:hypothetical protein